MCSIFLVISYEHAFVHVMISVMIWLDQFEGDLVRFHSVEFNAEFRQEENKIRLHILICLLVLGSLILGTLVWDFFFQWDFTSVCAELLIKKYTRHFLAYRMQYNKFTKNGSWLRRLCFHNAFETVYLELCYGGFIQIGTKSLGFKTKSPYPIESQVYSIWNCDGRLNKRKHAKIDELKWQYLATWPDLAFVIFPLKLHCWNVLCDIRPSCDHWDKLEYFISYVIIGQCMLGD